MASDAYQLQLFNPPPAPTDAEFPLFSRLSVEVRLNIWRKSLERERFVRIVIADDRHDPDHYMIMQYGRKLISKLFRVCAESRQVAVKFYRVQQSNSVYVDPGAFRETHEIFYLNPEWDTVYVPLVNANPKFAQFVCDLQRHDPEGRGLQNIVLDDEAPDRIRGFARSLPPERSAAFRGAMVGLREVNFLTVNKTERLWFGSAGHETEPRHIAKASEMHCGRPLVPHSVPFERLAEDPRPGIERDLDYAYLGVNDPRLDIYLWLKLMKWWSQMVAEAATDGAGEADTVQPPQQQRYRFLLGQWVDLPIRTELEHLRRWVESEQYQWNRRNEEVAERRGRSVPVETQDEMARAPPLAVGLWSFPIEALGELLPLDKSWDEIDLQPWEVNGMKNLSGVKPELWLASLT